MPETFSWGPVSGQNAAAGHDVLPLTPLKYFIGCTFLDNLSFICTQLCRGEIRSVIRGLGRAMRRLRVRGESVVRELWRWTSKLGAIRGGRSVIRGLGRALRRLRVRGESVIRGRLRGVSGCGGARKCGDAKKDEFLDSSWSLCS